MGTGLVSSEAAVCIVSVITACLFLAGGHPTSRIPEATHKCKVCRILPMLILCFLVLIYDTILA